MINNQATDILKLGQSSAMFVSPSIAVLCPDHQDRWGRFIWWRGRQRSGLLDMSSPSGEQKWELGDRLLCRLLNNDHEIPWMYLQQKDSFSMSSSFKPLDISKALRSSKPFLSIHFVHVILTHLGDSLRWYGFALVHLQHAQMAL